MTMGCGSSKKLQSVSSSELIINTTLLPKGIQSHEATNKKTNAKGNGTTRKTKKAVFRLDSVLTDKYEIKAQIGQGAFSPVFRAENKATRQPYAIKVMNLKDIRGTGSEKLFQSEIAILRQVKHRYIVNLYDIFTSKVRVYLVMELATGGDLYDRVYSRGHFTERDAARVICMVLDGVRYLHSHGITHRDLKPENLLYYHPGNDSRIMIADFGLSHVEKSAEDSVMATNCGSAEYQAPEMVQRKHYTNAVDMWAIGVITFILLSGRMPFDHEHGPKLDEAILAAKYSYTGEPWPDVSNCAKDFIDHLLVVDPEKRMTAEQALSHLWVSSLAASSSLKNLHEPITQNLFKQSSSRTSSAQSSSKYSLPGRSTNKLYKSCQSSASSSHSEQLQFRAKSKRMETHQSMESEINTKYLKQKPKLTAKQVVQELHTTLCESKAGSANRRVIQPTGAGHLDSSIDNLYFDRIAGKLDVTAQLLVAGEKNFKCKQSELESKRSSIAPVEPSMKYSEKLVLRDNFLSLDTPNCTMKDTRSNQKSSCEQNLLEPQSMIISRGTKVSSAF